MLIYAYLLKRLTGNKDYPDKGIVATLTKASPREPADYYFTPLFALMPYIPPMVEDMKRRNVPDAVISGTISEFEDKILDFKDRNHVPGICSYIHWLKMFTDLDIIRIGRFNMQINKKFPGNVTVYRRKMAAEGAEIAVAEDATMAAAAGRDTAARVPPAMEGPASAVHARSSFAILANGVTIHKSGMILGSAGCEDTDGSFDAKIDETDDYFEGFPARADGLVNAEKIRLLKTEWEVALRKDDNVVSVHIPARLSLDSDYCDLSYARAREIFSRHYPEYAYKAFMCQSWMMSPQLRILLGRETNLTRFIDRYMSYPVKATGTAVMDFVFFKKGKPEIKDLPEDTSLMRAIKNHYLAGGYVYEMGGVFF